MRAEHLRALAEFLEGLSELSNRTGVRTGGHLGSCVQVGGEFLELTADIDENDVVTYGVEQNS